MKRLHLLIPFILIASAALLLPGACDKLVTETNEITISGYPNADFVVNNDTCCRPCSVQFFDNSDGPRHKYVWDFGDGDSSTQKDPIHYYTDSGSFTVSLFIRDTINHNDDNEIKVRFIRIQDTIPKIPSQSYFVFVRDTVNDSTFHFADSTRGTIKTWRWNFGDSTSPGAGKFVSHKYMTQDTFEVRLTILNDCDSAELVDTVIVN